MRTCQNGHATHLSSVSIINIYRSRAMKENVILISIFYIKNTNEDEIMKV